MLGQCSACTTAQDSPGASRDALATIGATAEPECITPSYSIKGSFNQSQLALALTLQKSKPMNMSTPEYCRQLRRCIKAGKRPTGTVTLYVDTYEFWKAQYAKLYAENKKMEDKINTMEMEQWPREMRSQKPSHNPAAEIEQTSTDLHTGAKSVRRRPALDDQYELWHPSPQEQSNKPSAADDILLRLGSYVLRIGRQRANLDRATQIATDITKTGELVTACSQTLIFIDVALSDCCISLRSFLGDGEDREAIFIFQKLLLQVKICFHMCFHTLNKLCQTSLGRSKQASIIYQMVKFFKGALDMLRQISTPQSKNLPPKELLGIHQQEAKVRQAPQKEYAVSKLLAQMLVSVIQGMDWSIGHPGHSELIEGLLFAILEHTGRLVSEAIFVDHVASSRKPGHIMEEFETADKAEASSFESKYIVQILYATIGGAKKELTTKILASAKISMSNQTQSDRPSTLQIQGVLSKIKMIIQGTLVKSAIGGSDLEILVASAPPEENPMLPLQDVMNVENYGSDWLIGAIWALVGWDLV